MKLFSWYFSADDAVASKTLVLFQNGGPGCSSLMGLLYENGPFGIDAASGQPLSNPYSWTRHHHLLYVDAPAHTGLSYGGPLASDELQMASSYVTALEHFFTLRPHLLALDLYFTGESYTGKTAPYVAQLMLAKGWNLRGLALGNAMVDPFTQVASFSQVAFAFGFVDAAQRTAMEAMQKSTQALIQAGKFTEANDGWNNVTVLALNAGGWFNPADIRLFGFPQLDAATAWLNRADIRKAMGVPAAVGPFTFCNGTVGQQFAGREMMSVAPMYANLMDAHGLRLLFFNGNLDFTIPTIGTEQWMMNLDFSGSAAFRAANRTIWRYNSQDPFAVAGFVRQTRSLTLVSVVNAGHQVCQDQQERSLEMMRIFTQGEVFPQGSPFPPPQNKHMQRRMMRMMTKY